MMGNPLHVDLRNLYQADYYDNAFTDPKDANYQKPASDTDPQESQSISPRVISRLAPGDKHYQPQEEPSMGIWRFVLPLEEITQEFRKRVGKSIGGIAAGALGTSGNSPAGSSSSPLSQAASMERDFSLEEILEYEWRGFQNALNWLMPVLSLSDLDSQPGSEVDEQSYSDLKDNFLGGLSALPPLRDRFHIISPPNNVVLVDLFNREFDESLAYCPDLEPAFNPSSSANRWHTVCLWKIEPQKILVIDPSSAELSRRILKKFHTIFFKKQNFSLAYLSKKSFYEFYKPPPQSTLRIGRLDGGNVRDCIDIAVKIAFKLNRVQRICGSMPAIPTKDSVGVVECIKVLSNNLKINQYLFNSNDRTVIRGFHSASMNIANAVVKLFIENQKSYKRCKFKTTKEIWEHEELGLSQVGSLLGPSFDASCQLIDKIKNTYEVFRVRYGDVINELNTMNQRIREINLNHSEEYQISEIMISKPKK